MPTPPKDAPKRRNARVGPVVLPAEGRQGRAPAWPLTSKATAAERRAWTELWHTPQATAWERLGWTRTVARYCRIMVAAEMPDASASLLGQVSTLEDRLGLTPKAMRLLLWTIADDEVGAKREETPAASSSRRLRAVDASGS